MELDPSLERPRVHDTPEREAGGASPVLRRRSFLGLAAASASLAACSRLPVRHALPYLVPPEEITPGVPVRYAGTCGACPAACGLIATVRDGRPVKLEGDPGHALSRGGLCALGQGDLRALYDAGRLPGPRVDGRATTWAELDGFVAATAETARDGLRRLAAGSAGGATPRVLFSAHGLPEKVVARGDPYRFQVERTAAAVVAALEGENFDWTVCYQSRVGPLAWIRPYTEDEIRRAGGEGVPLVVVPIAFVSEHSETLVELDIEYRKLAEQTGVPAYHRAPAVGTDAAFIAALGRLAAEAAGGAAALCSGSGGRLCPPDRTQCAFAVAR